MGWDFSFGHMRYGGLYSWGRAFLLVQRTNCSLKGDRWKAHRRMFYRQFQQSMAPGYWAIQRREAHALLRLLLQTPDSLVAHLRK